MTEESKRREWSLVVTAISPTIWMTSENVDRIIGRRGLDIFGLTFQPDKHIPAEICDGLTKEEALQLASQLQSENLSVEVRLTSELTDVKHRASEVWSARCTDTYCFAEIDGIITVMGAINARDNIEHIKQTKPDWTNWQIESYLNHMHLDNGKSDAECIENGEKSVAELVTSLQQAYPGYAFTVSHIPGSIMSFWQTTPESPTVDSLPYGEDNPDKAWCRNCRKPREYTNISYVDQRFSKAEWGKCKVCGTQILVRKCERLTFIT